MEKLRAMRVDASIIFWITDELTGRTQFVQVGCLRWWWVVEELHRGLCCLPSSVHFTAQTFSATPGIMPCFLMTQRNKVIYLSFFEKSNRKIRSIQMGWGVGTTCSKWPQGGIEPAVCRAQPLYMATHSTNWVIRVSSLWWNIFKATLCNFDCNPLLQKTELNAAHQYVTPNSNYGETVSHFTEKMSSGFPSDVLWRLCLSAAFYLAEQS